MLAVTACLADRRPRLHFGPTLTESSRSFSSALFQTVGTHMRDGHRIDVLDNGMVFDALVDEIGSAVHSIHVVMYIWDDGAASDRIMAAIAERTRAGVSCRILIDAFGSRDSFEEVAPRLRAIGCSTRAFRPRLTLDRNHRKIVVIDGHVAFTGGFGIRDVWLGTGRSPQQWRDTAVQFEGAAVLDAQQAFAHNWLEAGGALLPLDAFPQHPQWAGPAAASFVTSTGSRTQTAAERVVQLMIAAAQERVWIANAYFAPPRPIRELLEEKASAGVDVRILTAGSRSNWRVYRVRQRRIYRSLLHHGVRVWEYEPTMMHSKAMVVDDHLSLVGSINLEPLSLTRLEEAALVVDDPATNDRIARAFLTDCNDARERRR